jgi:8-oxo-dGTP pyrophosphatase MutT (NUDIX family)
MEKAAPTAFYDMHGNVHVRPEHVDPQWRPSVYVLLKNEEQELLVLKTPWSDCFDLAGGALEFGESFVEAAVREAYEETGYEIECDNFPSYIRQGRFFVPAELRKTKQDAYYCSIAHFYHARLKNHEQNMEVLRKSRETVSTHWVRQHELHPDQVLPFFRDVLTRS